MLASANAEAWERDIAGAWSELTALLEQLSLKQERRALRLMPTGLKLEPISDTECWVEFELVSGAFATSVLRELCVTAVAKTMAE